MPHGGKKRLGGGKIPAPHREHSPRAHRVSEAAAHIVEVRRHHEGAVGAERILHGKAVKFGKVIAGDDRRAHAAKMLSALDLQVKIPAADLAGKRVDHKAAAKKSVAFITKGGAHIGKIRRYGHSYAHIHRIGMLVKPPLCLQLRDPCKDRGAGGVGSCFFHGYFPSFSAKLTRSIASHVRPNPVNSATPTIGMYSI